MQESHYSLADLVGSRLCHDLVSPIGAIQNGLELLSLSGGSVDAPEMALIRESCESATARIRFFRVAFGLASPGQMMGQKDIASNLAGFCAGSRLVPFWAAVGDQPRTAVQLIFLAFLCVESTLPQGGELRVEKDAQGWHLSAVGPRINVNSVMWSLLDNHNQDLQVTADKVQFALLAGLARDRGFRLHLRHSAASLRLDMRAVADS